MSGFAHSATCVAIGERALLIEGPTGSGKSSLALALIDRGAVLVGDDGVWLEPRGGALLASPHRNIAGKLEVRNLGLLDFPTRTDVPVSLVVRLDPDAPRFIDSADICEIGGVALPLILLAPSSPVLHLTAEHALIRYGLRP